MEVKEISLPSGAVLKFQAAPFIEAQELFEALVAEMRPLKFESNDDLNANIIKDIFCAGFTSARVKKALTACFKRCRYNDEPMRDINEVFEDTERRQDYIPCCYEVAVETTGPFVKSLFAKLSPLLETLKAPSPA